MKRDKDIEKLVDENLDDLRDDNFKQQLFSMQNKKDIRTKETKHVVFSSKLKVALTSICSVLTVVVVLLCVLLITPNILNDDTQYGGDYNEEVSQAAQLVEIDNLLYGYKLNINSDSLKKCEVISDKGTGDILYYKVFIENDEFVSCIMKFCENDKYDVSIQNHLTITDEVEISGIKFNIGSSYDFEEADEIYFHKIYAEAVLGKVKIFIDGFENITETEDSGFVDFMQNIFLKS